MLAEIQAFTWLRLIVHLVYPCIKVLPNTYAISSPNQYISAGLLTTYTYGLIRLILLFIISVVQITLLQHHASVPRNPYQSNPFFLSNSLPFILIDWTLVDVVCIIPKDSNHSFLQLSLYYQQLHTHYPVVLQIKVELLKLTYLYGQSSFKEPFSWI